MLKVLVVENNQDHFDLIKAAFRTAMPDVILHQETALAQGIKTITKHYYDVFLCNLDSPDSPQQTTVETLKALNSTTPIIVLTSLNNTNTAKALLRHGVQDYLPKEELTPTLLHRMCTYAIERKQTQIALQERNDDLQMFCATLSHDFKEHLRRISEISAFIQEDIEERIALNVQELKWFERQQSSLLGIHHFIDDLSDFISVDFNHAHEMMQPINLSTVFQSLRELILDTTEKEVEFIVDKHLPLVQGNAPQISLLFHNLIINAIKFNENNPKIKIQAHYVHAKNCCEISVSDNGIGIKDAHISQIFSPFRRLNGAMKYSGSGLGLSIVKHIVDRHGGELLVESKEGKGSTFTVALPLAAASGQYLDIYSSHQEAYKQSA